MADRCTSINNSSSDVAVEEKSIPLSNGKEFHVFFSYCDDEFVRTCVCNLVNVLEKDYRLICCYHLRNFDPGRSIFDNIHHYLASSMKIVIVVSKEYEQHPWCKYEMDFTLSMGMEMRQNIVIPVLIEDCKIPSHLKPLTYLDARGDKAIWLPKLIKAITSDCCSSQYVTNKGQCMDSFNRNLEVITDDYSKTHRYCCGKIMLESKYMPQQLLIRKMTNIDYNKIWQLVDSTYFEKRHVVRSSFEGFFCFTWIILALAGTVLCVYGKLSNDLRNAGIACFSCVLLITAALIADCCHMNAKGQRKLFETNLEAIKLLIDYNLMITISLGAQVNRLVFIHYDWKPCVEHVVQNLKGPNIVPLVRTREYETSVAIMMDKTVSSGNKEEHVVQHIEDPNNVPVAPSIVQKTSIKIPTDNNVSYETQKEHVVQHIEDPNNVPIAPFTDQETSIKIPMDDTVSYETQKEHVVQNIEVPNNVHVAPSIEQETSIKIQRNNTVSKETKKKYAINMLLHLSMSYLYEFNRRTLPAGNRSRHCAKAICLCEYAEMKGFITFQSDETNVGT